MGVGGPCPLLTLPDRPITADTDRASGRTRGQKRRWDISGSGRGFLLPPSRGRGARNDQGEPTRVPAAAVVWLDRAGASASAIRNRLVSGQGLLLRVARSCLPALVGVGAGRRVRGRSSAGAAIATTGGVCGPRGSCRKAAGRSGGLLGQRPHGCICLLTRDLTHEHVPLPLRHHTRGTGARRRLIEGFTPRRSSSSHVGPRHLPELLPVARQMRGASVAAVRMHAMRLSAPQQPPTTP